MTALDVFLAYAADFEKSFVDDEWSRLERFFDDDAVYRIESNAFGCEITGPTEILAGMKKSLDGLDRRFDGRKITITDGPHAGEDDLRVTWVVTYSKEGLPSFDLHGASYARVRDGRIQLLVDSYDDAVAEALDAWVRETGFEVDPSYV